MNEISVDFRFRSNEEFYKVRHLVREFIEKFLPEDKMIFLTAIHEAVNNAIEHDKNKSGKKNVRLYLKVVKDKRLIARIRDSGDGFDSKKILDNFTGPDSEQNILETLLKESGRGILIMLRASDYLKYNKKGNEVLLSCKVPDGSYEDCKNRLLLNNEVFSEIVNSTSNPIVVLDRHGSIRYVNTAIKTILGLDEDSLIGKDCRKIGVISPETVQLVSDNFSNIGTENFIIPALLIT